MDLASPQNPHAAPHPPAHPEVGTANSDAASVSGAADAPHSAAQQSKAVHQQATADHGNLQEEAEMHISRDSSMNASSSPPASQAASAWQQTSVQHSNAQEHQPQGSELQMPQYPESLLPQSKQASAQDTASSNLNALEARTQPGIEATAAAAAAKASSSPLLAANERIGSLSSASTSMKKIHRHDSAEALAADGARQAGGFGIPSDCSGCFTACVETCATSGLGLDALNAALLELANAPSLASGQLASHLMQAV